ncbi:unnamed protein product, partial [Brenthis ino]
MEQRIDLDMIIIRAEVEEKEEKSLEESTTDHSYLPDDTESSHSSSLNEFWDSVHEDAEVLEVNEHDIVSKKRARRQPERFGYSNFSMSNNVDACDDDNLTYEDVMNGTEREAWCKAVDEELQSFSDIVPGN